MFIKYILRIKDALVVIRGIYRSYYAHLPIDMFIRLQLYIIAKCLPLDLS